MKSHIPSFSVAVKESAAMLNRLTSIKDVEATYTNLYKALKSLWEAQATCKPYRRKTLTQVVNSIPLIAAACKRGEKNFYVEVEQTPLNMKEFDSMVQHFAGTVNQRDKHTWVETTLASDYANLKAIYEMRMKDEIDLDLIQYAIGFSEHYGALIFRAKELHRAKFVKKAA